MVGKSVCVCVLMSVCRCVSMGDVSLPFVPYKTYADISVIRPPDIHVTQHRISTSRKEALPGSGSPNTNISHRPEPENSVGRAHIKNVFRSRNVYLVLFISMCFVILIIFPICLYSIFALHINIYEFNFIFIRH